MLRKHSQQLYKRPRSNDMRDSALLQARMESAANDHTGLGNDTDKMLNCGVPGPRRGSDPGIHTDKCRHPSLTRSRMCRSYVIARQRLDAALGPRRSPPR